MNSFSAILQDLVERVPGATGAIFADWEGEAVGEFAREMATLDIRIFGAQWGVVWAELQRSLGRAKLPAANELIIGGEIGMVLVREVTEHYYVVLAIAPDAHLAKAMTELQAGADALRAEM